MAKERYQTRLEEVDAERVDDFKQTKDIETKAEATRRLLRRGLEDWEREHEDAVDDPDPETVVTDRSGVARRVLEDAANLYAAIAIIPSALYTLRLVGVVDFAVFSMPQLHRASLTAALLFVVCLGALYTRLPERIDRALYAPAQSVRGLVDSGAN